MSCPSARSADDGIAAAAGPADSADLDRVNLARRLSDGEHLHVPRRGEQAAAASESPSDGASPSGGKLDINAATADQLQSLPGIGEKRAAAIVEHRAANGPFDDVEDLVLVSGIGDGIIESIRDLVEVR